MPKTITIIMTGEKTDYEKDLERWKKKNRAIKETIKKEEQTQKDKEKREEEIFNQMKLSFQTRRDKYNNRKR
jgi:hypothetical protein